MTPPPLTVSLSAIQSFRTCEQQYEYRYVQHLRRKDKAPAPELGIILHAYLDRYYRLLKANAEPLEAHEEALSVITSQFRDEVAEMARVVARFGQDDLAKDLLDLPNKALRICDRYFTTRGRDDADAFDILIVEEPLSIPLFKGRMISNGRLDLVTRGKDDGRVCLWKHKSTTDIPDQGFRLRDLQTPLYAHKIEKMGLVERIDAVIWNYLRTVEPTVPEVLKAGGLTRRANLDSTWEVYLEALERENLDPADYDEQRQRLEGREIKIYFPRFDQPIISETDVLYRDYLKTAYSIAQARHSWRTRASSPVRTLTRSCDWCDFVSLCNAALLGGSDEDAIKMRFTKSQ